MAQTSTRRKSQARRKPSGRANGSGRSAGSRQTSRSTVSRNRTTSRSRSRRPSSNGTARTPKEIATKGKDAVVEGAQNSGKTIANVADKIKGPALAGGAALAGLAGGMAVQSRRDSRRRITRFRLRDGAGEVGKNLADAGQKAGRFSENLGAFAAEMRRTREAIDSRSQHRSPIEVVLQALTARR